MKYFTYQALGSFLLFFTIVLWHPDAQAQYSLTAGGTVTENFNDFRADGFSPTPSSGQLNSNEWFVRGMSDGSMTPGDTEPSGDFARGDFSTPRSTGGVHALIIGGGDHALWIQPGGSDFTPGSVTMVITNNTGGTITSIDLDYNILYRNDQGRANSLNLSYSTDNSSYTAAPAFDFTTPGGSTGTSVQTTNFMNSLSVTVANGDNLYLRWEGDDVSGSGSRDEYGLDDISIQETPPPCVADAGTLIAPSSDCAIASLSASASSFQNDGDYTQTYLLTDASGNILDIQSSGQFSNIAAGSYLVASFNYLTSDGAPTTSDNINTYSKGTDCFDYESQAFNVGDPQPAFTNPPSVVCENGIATLSLSASYFDHDWSVTNDASITNGGNSGDNFAEISFGYQSTTVSVTVTDAYGCTAQASQNIAIGSTPDLAQQGCTNCGLIRLRVCEGDPAPDLNAYIMGGNSAYVGGYSLNWCEDSDGEPGGPIPTPTIDTSSPGVYTFYVSQESPDGCESEEKTEVFVRVRRKPDVSLATMSALCEGASIDLALFVSDAANRSDLYEFYNGDPANGGTALGSATATNGVVDAGESVVATLPMGTYTIYVVGTNLFGAAPNCPDTATQTLVINPMPSVDPVADVGPLCPGDPIQVSFTGSHGANVYVWNNTQPNPTGLATGGVGDINDIAGPNTSGAPLVDQVTVFAVLNNCTSTPETFNVTVGSDPVLASGLTDMTCSRVGANVDLAGNSVTNMPGETFKWAAPTLSAPMTGTGSEALIGKESFDGGGVGYSTSNTFYDGAGDYFTLTNGSTPNIGPNYLGADGSNFWAAEDTDDNGGDGADEKTLTLNAINISAATNPRFEGLFAANRNNRYDIDDYIYVEYNVDNTGWNRGLTFSYINNGDNFNEPLAFDSDNDGEGDGTQLTSTFQSFGFNIPSGNSVQVRVMLHMDSGDEEVAFDNLQVFGTLPGGGARTTPSAAPITDGYQNTTGSPQTVTYMVVPVSAIGCEGDPVPVVVTVKPEPVVASASATVCSGENVNVALSEANSMPGVSFSWLAPQLPAGVYALSPCVGGNGNSITGYSFVNTSLTPQDVIFEASGTSGAGCMGEAMQITVTVMPATEGNLSTIQACESGPGVATFDLSNFNAYEKVGKSWVALPNSYTTGSTSIFTFSPATGACSTAIWTQVDLSVDDAPLSPSVSDIDICEGGDTKITPGAPGPQAFEATWEFDGEVTTGQSSFGSAIPQDASFGSGVSSISFPSGNFSSDSYSANNWSTGAIDANDYIEFCVKAEPGWTLDITGIEFDERRSGSGPLNIHVYYSTGPFTSIGASTLAGSTTVPDNTSWRNQSFGGLSISEETEVCFRIYGYFAQSTLGTWRFDNVKITGTASPTMGAEAADFMWTFENGAGGTNAGMSSSSNGAAANAAFGPGNGSISFPSGNGSAESYSSNSWSTGALNTNEYIEFCVSANPGWEMELTDLEFDERRSSSGIRDFDVYYSLDNFATAGTLVGSETVPDNTSWRGQEFELTISGATQVCFRIYGYNAEGSGGTWRFDNIVISGSLTQMAIPAASAFNFYDDDPNNGGQLLAGNVPCYDPQTAPGSSQVVWVTAIEGNCESAAVPVNVNVKPAPFIQATTNSPVCEGSDITLSAAGQAIQYNWTGPNNFSFQGANGTITAATPANSGQYQLVGIDGDGCSDTVYTQVQVDAAPHAGNGTHVTFTTSDPTVNLFNYLINNPQTGGVWAAPNGTPLPTGYLGLFNPATQLPGYYTYTVSGTGACAQSHYDSARVLVNIVAPPTPPTIAASVMLQGAYDQASGLMTDGLRVMGLVPLTEPFTGLGYTHVGGGAEYTSQQVLNVTGMNAIVDWIVIELRDAQDPTQVIATRSALLQRDGDIVDVDGTSAVTFNMANPGTYYVAIFHRNHLKVMTGSTYSLGTTPATVDMSSTNTNIRGVNPMLQVNNVQLMFAGDADGDGQIQNTDDVAVWKTHVGTSGYKGGDYNLDGQIQNSDRMHLWVPNAGKGTQVPE